MTPPGYRRRMLFLDLGGGARLAALEPWQAEEFFDHVDGIREYLRPFITLPTRVSTVEDARRFLQRYAVSQAEDSGRLYGIWVSGVLSGGTVFRSFDATGGTCEIGVWLSPPVQGRGIMTTAVRHMIDWAITVRGLGRVEWLAVVGNSASTAVAKRVGMRFEGTKRSDYLLNGERYDSEVWSVISTEWPPAAGPT